METPNASSDILRQEILEQSKIEADGILEQARKECERVLHQAKKDADDIRSAALKNTETQVKAIEKKIFSSVHLEVKKQQLKGRERILNRIIQSVNEKLDEFRHQKDYKLYLKDSLIEAVLALKEASIQLKVGDIEKAILEKGLLKECDKVIEKKSHLSVKLVIAKELLSEGGVLAISKNGRTRFDNSFSAQLRRNENAMRLIIFKEVFTGDY